MSHTTSIDITCHTSLSSVELVKVLLDSGWNLNDHGSISMLPLHDNDQFGWSRIPFHAENVQHALNILTEKQMCGELLGIVLMWQDSQVGGEVLLATNGVLTFIASINREKLLREEELTDVNWYLQRLIVPLMRSKIGIEAFVWTEYT